MDTALLKLYAELDPSALTSFISTERSCNTPDCLHALSQHNCHHALALLHHCHGNDEQALQIWTAIAEGSLKDDAFPGIDFLVDFLSQYEFVFFNSRKIL